MTGYPMNPLNMQNYQTQLNALQNQIAQIGQLYQQPPVTVPAPAQHQQQIAAPAPVKQIEYVNGLEGAKAYQMEKNSSAILMDSNENRFYAISCDANGFKSIKTCNFTEAPEEDTAGSEYATKKDFAELNSKVTELLYKIERKGETE